MLRKVFSTNKTKHSILFSKLKMLKIFCHLILSFWAVNIIIWLHSGAALMLVSLSFCVCQSSSGLYNLYIAAFSTLSSIHGGKSLGWCVLVSCITHYTALRSRPPTVFSPVFTRQYSSVWYHTAQHAIIWVSIVKCLKWYQNNWSVPSYFMATFR